MLAPAAFLASVASTLSLQNDILAGSVISFDDKNTSDAICSWKSLSHAEIPPEPVNRFQKVWDTVVSAVVYDEILSRCPGDADLERLNAANSPHTGDWLSGPPIASVGLRLAEWHSLINDILWRAIKKAHENSQLGYRRQMSNDLTVLR